jgi:hypothetical protein
MTFKFLLMMYVLLVPCMRNVDQHLGKWQVALASWAFKVPLESEETPLNSFTKTRFRTPYSPFRRPTYVT